MARKRFVTGESAPTRGGKECENLPAALQEQLEALLQKIEKMRSSLYPPDWRYDPLYLVAQELRQIIRQLEGS
jgi:hypothetical protein